MLTALWQTKSAVSFPHVIRKVMMPHSKNVLTWCISMYDVIGLKQTRGIKKVTLKAVKKFVDVTVYWEE